MLANRKHRPITVYNFQRYVVSFQTRLQIFWAGVIRRMVLHIAIFGYMQDGNLTDPKPSPNPKPNPNDITLTVTLVRSLIRTFVQITLITHANRHVAAKNI